MPSHSLPLRLLLSSLCVRALIVTVIMSLDPLLGEDGLHCLKRLQYEPGS